MARAKSICVRPGCYEYAVKDGRCTNHALQHGWGTSTRVKPKGWEKMRSRVLARARYRCVICGGRAVIADHKVAQRFGGGDNQANLQAMCSRCHNAKTQDEARLGKSATRMSAPDLKAAITELVARWS